MSPGHRLIASLDIHHSCTPAEVLLASQGDFHSKFAQRAKTAVLTASTWNICSMVDTEVPVAVAVCVCVCVHVCVCVLEVCDYLDF